MKVNIAEAVLLLVLAQLDTYVQLVSPHQLPLATYVRWVNIVVMVLPGNPDVLKGIIDLLKVESK